MDKSEHIGVTIVDGHTILVDPFEWDEVTSNLCKVKDVGLNGNLYGGTMMSWIDDASAIYASLVTNEKYIVTYRFDEMIFRSPVKAGEIVKFYAKLIKVGEHSVTMRIMAIDGSHKRFILTTNCTFVAVDENTKKKKLDRYDELIKLMKEIE